MNYFVYIDGILGVETNAKSFEWSYGTVAPPSTKKEFDMCKVKLYLDVVNDSDVFPADTRNKIYGKFHYFFANPNDHTIYYDRNFFFGKRLRYMISMGENTIHVRIGKTYYKHVHHRVMNLHSIGYILTDLTAGLLLLNGYATLHCSAINDHTTKRSVIIFAPPNTGKTLTSMNLCKKYNANFIAEDFALTDGVNVWAVPWTSTFRLYDEVNESKWDKLINKITAIIPALELIKLSKNKSIDKYIGEERIIKCSTATDVVVLERGDTTITHDKENGIQKLLTLNRYEFNYHKAPALVVMNYFNPDMSPEDMLAQEKKIFDILLKNTEYTCITCNDAMRYADIVVKDIIGTK